ncbi:MAG: cytochrome c oxidase assembly protein [Methylovirgula sp.]
MARSSQPLTQKRRGTLIASAVAVTFLGMLALSFAAVPLYRLFCAHTGFAGTTQVAHTAPVLRGKRDMVVRFDTNVGKGLPWTFVPDTPEITVRTGQTATVFFKVTNQSDRAVVAQAGYNVTPDQMGGYFDKISCFCFSTQKLGPHETADMPVVFFVDPALEQDKTMDGIDTVTLSYTFYPVARSTALEQGQGKAAVPPL